MTKHHETFLAPYYKPSFPPQPTTGSEFRVQVPTTATVPTVHPIDVLPHAHPHAHQHHHIATTTPAPPPPSLHNAKVSPVRHARGQTQVAATFQSDLAVVQSGELQALRSERDALSRRVDELEDSRAHTTPHDTLESTPSADTVEHREAPPATAPSRDPNVYFTIFLPEKDKPLLLHIASHERLRSLTPHLPDTEGTLCFPNTSQEVDLNKYPEDYGLDPGSVNYLTYKSDGNHLHTTHYVQGSRSGYAGSQKSRVPSGARTTSTVSSSSRSYSRGGGGAASPRSGGGGGGGGRTPLAAGSQKSPVGSHHHRRSAGGGGGSSGPGRAGSPKSPHATQPLSPRKAPGVAPGRSGRRPTQTPISPSKAQGGYKRPATNPSSGGRVHFE